jgi:hypothetical protein
MGKVYIITNPELHGWVKIGQTSREKDKRLKEYHTYAPKKYVEFAYYDCGDDYERVEKNIQDLIDDINPQLRGIEKQASGKVHKSEWFAMSPETALGLFYKIANMRGDVDKVIKIDAPDISLVAQKIAEQSENRGASTPKAERTTFEMLSIPHSAELQFVFDDSVRAYVKDNKNTISLDKKEGSITGVTLQILKKTPYNWSDSLRVSGWLYWKYNNEKLSDIRQRLETIAEITEA